MCSQGWNAPLPSPRPQSLNPNDRLESSVNEQDQILDQVISLENEFSDTSIMMTNVGSNVDTIMNQNNRNNQHQLVGDINFNPGLADDNQFSSSSEDLLNLLLEFDREPSNLMGLNDGQPLDQDEKIGIENIRKQLMSCDVQSDQQHSTSSMSPIINHMDCQPQMRPNQLPQYHTNIHQQQVPQQQQQLISQTAPVSSRHLHQQSPHQLPSPVASQIHQPVSTDQPLLHGSYSSATVSTVPVSSSSQPSFGQHANRTSQTSSMSIVNNSPSPSWQQPQLSPYSPQPPHRNSRTPTQQPRQPQLQTHQIHQQQQQHSIAQQQQSIQHQHQPHQMTTSPHPQQQQPHHPSHHRSPSQSVSPPASSEPSPVVKKNPLLNAQLVNTRGPSMTPTRFMGTQANVLNQNPILNAKLSQSPFINSNDSGIVSPVNPSLHPQPGRYIQHSPQPRSSQQPGHVSLYGPGGDQQTSQIFRTTPTPTVSTCSSSLNGSLGLNDTSPSGPLGHQVKQEIRRNVQQQPKQHQQTSLLKQLLSDDNK